MKLGFTGVYIIFLISAKKHRLWVHVRTGTHNLCFEKKYEEYQNLLSENFHFLVVKFSVYLNRHVFLMYLLYKVWTSQFYYLTVCLKTTGWVANGIDLDQMLHSVGPDPGLHCLLRLVFHNTITETRLFRYIENFTTKKGKKKIIKNSDIFHISVQNIDCGYSLELPRRGSSNEYPQPMFLSRNKKNNVYPCKPQFYYIKVGFKGVIII